MRTHQATLPFKEKRMDCIHVRCFASCQKQSAGNLLLVQEKKAVRADLAVHIIMCTWLDQLVVLPQISSSQLSTPGSCTSLLAFSLYTWSSFSSSPFSGT